MNEPVELSRAECRDLLETEVVGRIVFVTPHGPRIVPVNYTIVDDVIEIRTAPNTELATYAVGTQVVFELDHPDGSRQRGWSVVVHALCAKDRDVRDGERRFASSDPELWAGGERPIVLRLPLDNLTGRRVGGPHWPHPVVSGRRRPY